MDNEFSDIRKALGILVLIVIVPGSVLGLLMGVGERLGLGFPVYIYVVQGESPGALDAAIHVKLESSLHELGFHPPSEIDLRRCGQGSRKYAISSLDLDQSTSPRRIYVHQDPCGGAFRFEIRADSNADGSAKLIDAYFRVEFSNELKAGTLKRIQTTRIDLS